MIVVKEKDIQAIGIITVQLLIILLTLNVFLENVHLSRTESLGRIISGMIMISLLFRRLMATLNASFAVSFAKINLSSVQNATIFATGNVGGSFNSGLYSFLVSRSAM